MDVSPRFFEILREVVELEPKFLRRQFSYSDLQALVEATFPIHRSRIDFEFRSTNADVGPVTCSLHPVWYESGRCSVVLNETLRGDQQCLPMVASVMIPYCILRHTGSRHAWRNSKVTTGKAHDIIRNEVCLFASCCLIPQHDINCIDSKDRHFVLRQHPLVAANHPDITGFTPEFAAAVRLKHDAEIAKLLHA